MSWCEDSEVSNCQSNKLIETHNTANEPLILTEATQAEIRNLSQNIYKLTDKILLEKSQQKKQFSRWGWLALSLAVITTTVSATIKPAQAEGSRNLYGPGATGARANLNWRSPVFFFGGGSTPPIRFRTLLKVYAVAGENILLGSSAVGVPGKLGGGRIGDILVYGPNKIPATDQVGDEVISAPPDFSCNAQRALTGNTAQGRIESRAQELAGPKTVAGGGPTAGYIPCVYKALTTGIYNIVFYGPNGDGSTDPDVVNSVGQPTGDINLTDASNFDDTQGSTVAAWDVTVRSSNINDTVDINNRLFTFYLSLLAGANGRTINSSLYPVTIDGFRYKVDLKGLDPNGFIIYANRAGFLDPDGSTPLYHDVLGDNTVLTNLEGGVIPTLPEFPIFFSNTNNAQVNDTLIAITPPQRKYLNLPALPSSIATVPQLPTISTFSFTGTSGPNNTLVNTGGTFNYQADKANTYQIIISRNGDFDPTNPLNRVLRGLSLPGSQTIPWDGNDNSGNQFPVGNNYQVKLQLQAGDYHFPLLDAENSPQGGPSIQLLNPPNGQCPLLLTNGCSGGFYDDRGYRLSTAAVVGTVGSVLSGTNPPTIPNSNPITGYNTEGSDRAYGSTGSSDWGDTKGLDLWTYYPVVAPFISLNIIANNPDLNVTKTHTGNFVVDKQGTYTITVANKAGAGSTLGPITVTDTLPTGLTFVSATGTDWSCSANGQTITCNYTNATPVAAGVTLPVITVTVNVTPAAVVPGGIVNTATVNTPGDPPDATTPKGQDNTSSDRTTVLLPPVAYKSVRFLRDNNGNNILNAGDDIQYTLIIENPSTNPAALTGVVIRDTIPVQVQLLQDGSNPISVVTTNNAGNPDFTLAAGNFNGATNQTVTFTNSGTLAPGGRVAITFNARVLPGAASPIANQGTVNFGGDGGTPVRTDASDTNNPTAPGSNNNPGSAGTGTGNNISQPNANSNDATIINIVSEVNPTGTKSVRLVVDADNSGTVTTGDTIEYTVTYVNNNLDVAVNDLLVTDSIETRNLDFVPGSYSFQSSNGFASSNNVTTVTGNSNYNGTTDTNLTNPTTRGSLGAGGGKVIMTFRALVKAPANTSISNQAVATSTASRQGVVTRSPSLTDALSTPTDIPQSLGGLEDPTLVPVAEPGPPRLRLVKRITRVFRNGAPLSGVNFSNYVSVNADDQAPGWSQLSPVGVPGLPPTIAVESGDEVEYTIYYLSDGSGPANDLKFCDLIPAGTTYLPDSFGVGSGISFNRSGTVRSLTNNADADEGTFFSAIAPLPSGNTCSNQSNPDGAAIVNFNTISSVPGNNYGFVRFRVKVK